VDVRKAVLTVSRITHHVVSGGCAAVEKRDAPALRDSSNSSCWVTLVGLTFRAEYCTEVGELVSVPLMISQLL
jgi:hypothetical protein